MPDYAFLAAKQARKMQLARYAPDCCAMYRRINKVSQRELARGLGVSSSVISCLENGIIKSWRVAEAALILNGEDMALLQVEETPGLRELLARWQSDNIPINWDLESSDAR